MITKKISNKPAAAATELDYEEGNEVKETPPATPPANPAQTTSPLGRPNVAGPQVFANAMEAYNAIGAGSAGSDVPAGKYEAVVFNATLEEPSQRGQAVRLNFALADENLSESEQMPTWFRLFNPDRSPNSGGIRAWKDTLARLGYSDVPFDELPAVLATIVDDKPGVVINLKYREYQGRKYPNIYVEGLCDNEVIARFKEEHTF